MTVKTPGLVPGVFVSGSCGQKQKSRPADRAAYAFGTIASGQAKRMIATSPSRAPL